MNSGHVAGMAGQRANAGEVQSSDLKSGISRRS